ncbi:hypothetical protein ABIF93_011297 [Bradyrhizobium japonicum]
MLGAEPGACACQHAAEFVQVGHGGAEALDAAANHELLIEHADGAEAGIGLGEHGAKGTIDALAPLGELLGADRHLGHLRPDLRRGRLRGAELLEQIGRRPALRAAGIGRRCGQDDGAHILERGFRHRHQPRCGIARVGVGRADMQTQGASRQRRAKRHELSALEIAKGFGLPPLHAEQVGGARHVDVEEGPAHQEIGGFRRDVLGEFCQALGRDDAGEATFTAAAHQIGHRAERELARLVRDLAGDRRREQLRLVDHHQHRVPMIAIDVEQAAKERRGTPHLVLGVQPFEIEHGGDAMQPRALARDLKAALGVILGLDHQMAELLGQRDEVAFGVDDGLLHPGRALFEQPPQQMRLAGARIALHQEPGRQQFLEVHGGRGACRGLPHLDRNCHAPTQVPIIRGVGLINPAGARRAALCESRGVAHGGVQA